MATPPSLPFGALLRRYRVLAGLTQEALAERAGLSVRAISDLERGVNRAPQPATLLLLADALKLSAEDRTHFEAAARREKLAEKPTQLTSPAAPAGLILAPTPDTVLPTPAAPEMLSLPSAPEAASPPEAVDKAPSRAILPRLPRVQGKGIAGLISGLLVVAILESMVVLKNQPGVIQPGPSQTLCLASDFPTSSIAPNELSESLLARDAVNLAVKQNQHLGGGYILKVINDDDTSPTLGKHDPMQGAQNVADMVKNPCIVGMVGPLNDDVAQAEMPIAANAGLVMISPANTNPGLTLRLYEGDISVNFNQLHPLGKPITYFRTIPNDVFQGQMAADFTWKMPPDGLGARRAYVVEDNSPLALDLFAGFTKEYLAKGGTILGTDAMPSGGSAQLALLASRIVAAQPEAVFYAGTTDSGGGFLKAQLTKAGYTGLFVGGNAIANDPRFIDQAGADSGNDIYATVPLPDLSTFTLGSAAQFLHDFLAAYPLQTPEIILYPDGHIAYTYDAAMILITAIKHLIQTGQAVTRAAMMKQVQHIQYTGVTSPISFDTNGDIVHGLFSIYSVQSGTWVWVKQVTM